MSTISNQTFKNKTFTKVRYTNYSKCIFESVSFGEELNLLIFQDCSFNQVVFESKTVLLNVAFNNCNIIDQNLNFTDCILFTVKFINTNIMDINFTSARLSNMNFDFLNLSQANFSNANLNTISFKNTNLSNANFTNISTKNLLGLPSSLPSSWNMLSISTNNNLLIGPTVNLESIKLSNINLDKMNLFGANLKNATLTNVSVQDTILDNAILKGVVSSNITGTPQSLPIGTVIYNKQFYYTQDNIYLPKLETINPVKTFTNTISPIRFTVSNKNLLYSGVIQNASQFVFLYLSQEYLDPSAVILQSNTIYITDLSGSVLSTIQVPNFFISSLTAQSTQYGKGAMLIGYGYQNSILTPLKYITIRLDPSYQLDTLYESVGYKIQATDNTLYPSGYTEMFQNSSNLYYLTQSNLQQMGISKMNYIYRMDCSGINFSGKNLSGTDLSGRDFTNCDFSGTNLSYCNLTNANFKNANLYQTNLSYSILSNVNLTGAVFYKPNFTGIFLSSSSADFTLPNGFKFVNQYFIGPGLNLDRMDLSGTNLNNVNFTGSSLRNAILTNTKVYGTNFTNCILDYATTGRMEGNPIFSINNKYKLLNGFIVGPYSNLSNANLSKQDLSNMNLFGTQMNGTNLTECVFTNVKSGSIQGTPILSSKVKLINGYLVASGSSLNQADLSGGDLSGVDLTNTLLTQSNLYNVRSRNITGVPILESSYNIRSGFLVGPYVDLHQIDLSGVDLTSISLYGANVDGTNLRSSTLINLTSGNLRGTPILDPNYKLINGYIVGPRVNLYQSDLSGMDLSGMDLNGTNLQNAILTRVHPGPIKGTPILSTNYRLMKGYIVGRELSLRNINLEWQDFSDMDLYQTDFTNSKLNHSSFHRTFIFDTDFTNTECEDIKSSGLVGIPIALPEHLKIIESYIDSKPSRIFVGPSIKLENIEFRNQNLNNLDFSGSNLINIYFNNVSIDQTNFNQTNLFAIRSKNVSGTPVSLSSMWKIRNGYFIGPNANLMYSDFTNLDLSGTNLSDANLLNVKFQNTLPGPIEGTPILDFDWKTFDISTRRYIIGPGMNLSSMDLSGQNFTNMNLENVNLDQANLSNVSLKNVYSGKIYGTPTHLPSEWSLISGYLIGPMANLNKANLDRCNLRNLNLSYSILSNTKLNGTDLTGANLVGVRSGGIEGIPILPLGWKMVNGYLIGPRANVSDTDLSGADLSNLDLSGANFSRSNLSNVNLTHTNITNAIFLGANLTNIIPSSIYETIDLTGVILPLNNYFQYNYLISKNIFMSDFVRMKYKELKQRVYDRVFNGVDIRKDFPISLIKRLNLKLYDDLFILYTESANGNKDPIYFDGLTLLDVDTRFQMYQRTFTLINNMTYIDDFLLRLMNRFDIETIPENLLKNINFSLVLPETVAMFYMKHLLNDRFHSMILTVPAILEKVELFFRNHSKIYDDNLFVQNIYGVTNNHINESYQNIVKKYRYQVEIFENYLYVQDIVNKYTNASKIATIFRKMVDLDKKYVTPVVFDLFKRTTRKLFGPFSQRDDFDLYKLNENRIFISFEYEKYLVSQFISKNMEIVQSMFVIEPQLGEMWNEIQKEEPYLPVLNKIYSWINSLDTAIVFFRRQLFTNIKNSTYTYVYPKDITETVLTMRENNLDSMVKMSDENIDQVSEYLKDNPFVKRILQDPKQFIQDIEAPSFSSVQDMSKLYSFSIYSTPEMKVKMIKYDIRIKLEQDENRYVSLFASLSTDLKGDENLIAPLEEYRKVWNNLMN